MLTITSTYFETPCVAAEGSSKTHLIVVVIQVRISTLQLHHLDFGYPFLFFLSHQVTVGVSAAPVPSRPAAIPSWQINTKKTWSVNVYIDILLSIYFSLLSFKLSIEDNVCIP